MTLRIGTLGAARITPTALLKPAGRHPDVDVVAVAARDRGRAAAFAGKHGIATVFDSYEELVAAPDIDAVYVPLPNSHHAEWTIAAIEAGKHVLCEKPFTSNAAEARAVKAVADAHPEVVVMEAFHWRYHPLAQRVIDIVQGGDLGEVRHIATAMCIPLVLLNDIRWRLDLAGGAMMDVGCYAVSMLRHVAGAEPTVRDATAKLRSPGVDRRVEASFDFADGRTGAITASMLSKTPLWIALTVTGTEGKLRVINPTAPQYFHSVKTDSPAARKKLTPKIPRSETSYGNQLAAFHAAVAHGADFPTPPADSVANMTVIDAIYRAAGMEPRPARTA